MTAPTSCATSGRPASPRTPPRTSPKKARHSAIDGRTTRHTGYALSHKHRKRIEEAFGWAKTTGGMAQTVHRGLERIRSRPILTMGTNNLARLPRLPAAGRMTSKRRIGRACQTPLKPKRSAPPASAKENRPEEPTSSAAR